jgi:anti-sigma B factor antagonist
MSDLFTVTATSAADTLTLTLAGEVEAATLDGEIRSGLFTSEVTTLVLDLAEVTFIDSTGLGVVMGAHKAMRDRDGTLILRHPPGTVRRLLEVTLLTGELKIED